MLKYIESVGKIVLIIINLQSKLWFINKRQIIMTGDNMEKIYKTMRDTGAGSIAVGIIILVAGIVVGIISIINGTLLLKRKNELTF